MDKSIYSPLQIREIFHLEFLKWFGRKVKPGQYAIKGGANMRFFFNSFRYSEDMDLDIRGVSIGALKAAVIGILEAGSFKASLKPFGIGDVVGPDMTKAKQTETTQRFKAHLLTLSGEDLFTKLEFSRRGFKGEIIVQPVSDIILRLYKLAPLLVPHYDSSATIIQKIIALATRAAIQARDVFDIYILSSQYKPSKVRAINIQTSKLKKACENIFEISFEQFRDTVISYLSLEDQGLYNSESSWDEIKLKTANFIEELRKGNA